MFSFMQAQALDQDAPHGSSRAIIRRDAADGKPELVELRWGLRPSERGGRPFRFIRSEGKVFPSHRCLIPASEFHVTRDDRRFRFFLGEGNWFYLAGIWRPAQHDWPASFAILTVEACPEVAHYQERQGAIILRNRHLQWLDLSSPEDEQLVPLQPRLLDVEEISPSDTRQKMLTL